MVFNAPNSAGQELLNQLEDLHVHRNSAGQPSRHKPLALLWALGQVANGHDRLFTWSAFRDGVGELLTEFGLASSSVTPEYPFWHLGSSAELWEVHGFHVPSGGTPRRGALDDANPTAGLTAQVATLLRDHELLADATSVLLRRYLADVPQQELIRRVGLAGKGVSAWSFLISDSGGPHGSEPDPRTESYDYDSTMISHSDPATGDLVLVRDQDQILGVARIARVDARPGWDRSTLRCPNPDCASRDFGRADNGGFHCSACGTDFTMPTTVLADVTTFTAHYGNTWQSLAGAITPADLASMTLGAPAPQQHIHGLQTDQVTTLLRQASAPIPPAVAVPSGELHGGARRGLVTVRIGQEGFRKALLAKYGLVCAVTGPCPEEALEAAHLRAFARHGKHVVEEGLLLRADVHRLFDRGLIAIDPATRTAVVDPRLRGYAAYAALHNRPLAIPIDRLPSREALTDHHTTATSTWRLD